MKTQAEIKAELEKIEKEYRIFKDDYQKGSVEFKQKIQAMRREISSRKGSRSVILNDREILVLKNIEKGPTELGKMLGVSAVRAGQIRDKARRKANQMTKDEVAKILGLAV